MESTYINIRIGKEDSPECFIKIEGRLDQKTLEELQAVLQENDYNESL